jgi:hypothetical protein
LKQYNYTYTVRNGKENVMLQDSCQKEVVFESSLIPYVSAAIHDGVDQLREAVLELESTTTDIRQVLEAIQLHLHGEERKGECNAARFMSKRGSI